MSFELLVAGGLVPILNLIFGPDASRFATARRIKRCAVVLNLGLTFVALAASALFLLPQIFDTVERRLPNSNATLAVAVKAHPVYRFVEICGAGLDLALNWWFVGLPGIVFVGIMTVVLARRREQLAPRRRRGSEPPSPSAPPVAPAAGWSGWDDLIYAGSAASLLVAVLLVGASAWIALVLL